MRRKTLKRTIGKGVELHLTPKGEYQLKVAWPSLNEAYQQYTSISLDDDEAQGLLRSLFSLIEEARNDVEAMAKANGIHDDGAKALDGSASPGLQDNVR